MNWLKNKNKKNVLLISSNQEGAITSNDAVFPFPFLSLPLIAAEIPSRYSVQIIDERISRVSGKEKADIVFITSLTTNVYRAYELADIFRSRGIPVVLGGVHVSILIEEASRHATSIVAGEAEGLIETLLSDFEAGQLKPVYKSVSQINLDSIPFPELQLLNWRHRIFFSPIQTGRGCSYDCDFCLVPKLSERKLRLKSLETVERELKHLNRFRSRRLFVVDDNFLMKKERAISIMNLFRQYGYKWMGFSNLSISEDDRFLKALQDSGCISLFIGFESLNAEDLLLKNRSYSSMDAMRQAVSRIHNYNIGIQGSFIFGFDKDTVNVFQETVKFIQETGIELPHISILTPFPGTPLFEKMEKENRIIHKDWSKYDMSHTVFHPKNMTVEELQQGYAWALKYLASPTSIFSRLTNRPGFSFHFLISNFSLHRSQTRLARSLWNPAVQHSMQKRHLCLY
ncbi:MAG: B12-binding domain-containing radical SAM protein [Deltaproteobacteria bacterium]|nr:B12-binding domain-containing radical SAM protein [Deltaproteobacteria bacterium]